MGAPPLGDAGAQPPPGGLAALLAGGGAPQGPQFPTTDPAQVSGMLGGLQQAQSADQQQLQHEQMSAAVLALIDAMKNQPDPAAQAAVTEPGYPTPPPPASGVM